ncbi:hypothetical protein PG999_004574 [Apiospora kogelbergensis]|uniref:Peroxidase n=1 Tax=Apiospora kogelbergensis TaxID=1337665 RepID=A0AAW0QZP7_9PEZI
MATHDAAAATGGLDASIMYETDRPENPGDAFNITFGFFLAHFNGGTSLADMIALGLVTATANCGGPKVPLRVGRIDAGLFDEAFKWFNFNKQLDHSTGIHGFTVELTVPSTGAVTVHDNAGTGLYPINDSIMYHQSQSCMDTTDSTKPFPLTATAAVRRDQDVSVAVEIAHKVPVQGILISKLEKRSHPLKRTDKKTPSDDYVLYEMQMPLDLASWSTTMELVLGEGEGEKRVRQLDTNALAGVACQGL